MVRPIVFLTDWGLADEFVGVCHGVIARIAPDARVIDLTHSIPRQDVLRGALSIARATPYMPPDAVYLAVVDPDVGSARREVAVRAASGAVLVGPDNGILSLAWAALGGAVEAVRIGGLDAVMPQMSRTFHGRDVFAPAAAYVAAGKSLRAIGSPLEVASLASLELPPPVIGGTSIDALVVAVDAFGNVQLNVRPEELGSAGLDRALLTIAGRKAPRAAFYGEVAEGALAVIVDSQGYLALVVNHGSAADALGLAPGDTVILE